MKDIEYFCKLSTNAPFSLLYETSLEYKSQNYEYPSNLLLDISIIPRCTHDYLVGLKKLLGSYNIEIYNKLDNIEDTFNTVLLNKSIIYVLNEKPIIIDNLKNLRGIDLGNNNVLNILDIKKYTFDCKLIMYHKFNSEETSNLIYKINHYFRKKLN